MNTTSRSIDFARPHGRANLPYSPGLHHPSDPLWNCHGHPTRLFPAPRSLSTHTARGASHSSSTDSFISHINQVRHRIRLRIRERSVDSETKGRSGVCLSNTGPESERACQPVVHGQKHRGGPGEATRVRWISTPHECGGRSTRVSAVPRADRREVAQSCDGAGRDGRGSDTRATATRIPPIVRQVPAPAGRGQSFPKRISGPLTALTVRQPGGVLCPAFPRSSHC